MTSFIVTLRVIIKADVDAHWRIKLKTQKLNTFIKEEQDTIWSAIYKAQDIRGKSINKDFNTMKKNTFTTGKLLLIIKLETTTWYKRGKPRQFYNLASDVSNLHCLKQPQSFF